MRAEAARVGTLGWGDTSGEGRPAEGSCTRYELGGLFAAISLGPLQALILDLCIADGLGQHLAQLSLGLCGFPLGWLPLCHQQYVGIMEGKLNPVRRRINAAICRRTSPLP